MACCEKMKTKAVRFEDMSAEDPASTCRKIGIIGTGNYGRALAKRLLFSGYDVVVGSRKPGSRRLTEDDECLCDVRLTSIQHCLSQVQIVFIAVHVENFRDTFEDIADSFQNKIVIDVSNRENMYGTVSNAEYLQSMLVTARVVKAFNIISAYTMENDIAGGSRRVFIASNDVIARERVCHVARDMGFAPLDFGRLVSARRIEAFVLRLFPGWKVPLFITFGIFNLWALYVTFIYFVDQTVYRWDQIFLKVFNKPLCMTAITVMALTYLPGCVAAFLQILNGTKHKRFPKLLDRWLKARKQFGIICFTLVVVHVLISVLLMSPTYYSSWFQPTAVRIPANLTNDLELPLKTWMTWKGEAACLVGIIAFMSLCLLALTTIPSIGDSLNWREWRFIQSKLGYTVLFLSVGHVMIMGFPGWIKKGFPQTFGSITFLSLIIPMTVLFMKSVLMMPCVSKYVSRIRKGWERKSGHIVGVSELKDELLDGEEYQALQSVNPRGGCGCAGRGVMTVTPTPTCDCPV